MPFRLSARCSILLNLRNLPSLFSSNLLSKKKDRAAFAGGPSQGGNAPGKGSDSGGGGSYRVSYFLQIQRPRALTRLNFSLTFRVFAWRPFVLPPITSAGNRHPFPEGMLRQP